MSIPENWLDDPAAMEAVRIANEEAARQAHEARRAASPYSQYEDWDTLEQERDLD